MWEDHRDHDSNHNWDIYGCDLSTKEEFPIAVNQGDRTSPAIYGDIVVWNDCRNDNWDIYMYNLSTREEFQITTELYSEVHPAIYQDTIIWVERIDIKNYVYGYSLSRSEGFQLTTGAGKLDLPAVYGNIVVWMDLRNGDGDIYGYDLTSTILEKPEEPKNEGNGICLGTVFVVLILAGSFKPWLNRRIRLKIQQ